MKLINKTAFKIILPVLIAMIVMGIISIVYQLVNMNDTIASMMEQLDGTDTGGADLETIYRIGFIFGFIIAAIFIFVYYGLQIYFTLSHNCKPRKGRYLIVMLVFAILGIGGGMLTLLMLLFDFNLFTFISMTITILLNCLLIAGFMLHRKSPDRLDPANPPPSPSDPFNQQ